MYKDRGIIKWAPFDALVGFKSSIGDMKMDRNKKPMKILSEDQLAEFNYLIRDAINNDYELVFDYYEDGYTKRVFGKILKVDQHNQLLILKNNIKLPLNIITNIINS